MIKNISPPPQDLLLISLCSHLIKTFEALASDYQGHNKSQDSTFFFNKIQSMTAE